LNELITFEAEKTVMNFLAHAHLSGNNNQLLIGNFIADSVKGRDFNHFPEGMRQGIVLHRQIDSFTDSHHVFKKSLGTIRSAHGKYSGIVVDIFFDHFLALNWNYFEKSFLADFANHVYLLLTNSFEILPERTKRLLPYLIAQNWLVGYANFTELEQVFYGMDRRTQLASGMRNSVKTLKENYDVLERDFFQFYPELQQFVAKEIDKIPFNNTSSGQVS
jgi:acyl carrier protein phosphodiesterase